MSQRSSPPGRYPKLSTAPDCHGEQRRVRVTHPFHPLFGQGFDLLTYRNTWGEDRAYFHDHNGRLLHLPARWTDLLEPDPFVVISAGRSCFRLADLLALRRLIDELDAEPAADDDPTGVKQLMS